MTATTEHLAIARGATFDLRQLAPYLAGAGIFFLFSTPSIKLYVYSEAVNGVPVALLAAALLLNPPRALSRARLSGLMLGMMLFVVLFLFGAYNSASLDLVALVKYAILCLLCVLVCLAAERKALGVAAAMIAAWGMVLAVVQLGAGVTLDRSLGQNYLTLGYALGAAALIGLMAVTAAKSRWTKLAGLVCALVSLAAAATLLGRGPILFRSPRFSATWRSTPSLRHLRAR